ncbi:MAG: hypothetical protein MI923_13225 [Phycisphaerales bacterium]|nr:hypothetical protein [Phycisphaerales bacterium]
MKTKQQGAPALIIVSLWDRKHEVDLPLRSGAPRNQRLLRSGSHHLVSRPPYALKAPGKNARGFEGRVPLAIIHQRTYPILL